MEWHLSCPDTFLFAGPEDAVARPRQCRKAGKQEGEQGRDDGSHVVLLLVIVLISRGVSLQQYSSFLECNNLIHPVVAIVAYFIRHLITAKYTFCRCSHYFP